MCSRFTHSHLLISARSGSGSWASWSEWSGWAKGLCSGNQRVKTRACTNPMPSLDGEYCVGDNAVQQDGPGELQILLYC